MTVTLFVALALMVSTDEAKVARANIARLPAVSAGKITQSAADSQASAPTSDSAEAVAQSRNEASPAPTPTPPTQPSEPLRRRGRTDQSALPGQITVGGWTDASYTASTDSSSQLPMGFNYRANQFLLQQNWLRVERAVQTDDATEASFGFLSDTILPGTDYRFTLPRGLFNQQLVGTRGGPNLYGIDPVRFYAEAYLPGIGPGVDIRVGRFYAPWGIEAVDAPSNTFLSHSYTFVYDPFTQTGILATTKLNDRWSMQSALVIGNDEWFNPGNQLKYSGNVQWTAADKRNTLRFSTILGSPRYRTLYQLDNLNLFELIYSHQFSEDVKYVFATTFGYQTGVPTLGTADWIGYQNYLTKQINSKLTAALRVELFDDYKGQRTGLAGLYTDATIGIQAQITRRVRIRPELRLDDNSRSRPFDGRHTLFTAATDVIVNW
ncbi:MAG TPA: outer membrane beta-barrel protein [Pirellulales bacterium]|nr:outer membrane beta-barrel protein [Pirellulales bacterium]